MKKIVHIDGMHCEHCAASAQKALAAIPGVAEAKVDLAKKQAKVKLSGEVSVQAFKDAIANAGFTVTGVEVAKFHLFG